MRFSIIFIFTDDFFLLDDEGIDIFLSQLRNLSGLREASAG